MTTKRTVPTNEEELAVDLYDRVDDMIQARALKATVNGEGFTALDVAQAIEDSLPQDYPIPPQGRGYRIVAIHELVADRARELLADTPGALEEVPVTIPVPSATPASECPSWCNYHYTDRDLDGFHFGRIRVNDIEIDVEWDESNPYYGPPRVDVSGYEWVNGPELTDLAEALRIAERTLSAEGQVPA